MSGRKKDMRVDATRRHDERGFSLIEVMIAMVILTVGLLSLAQMMVLATKSNALSGRMNSGMQGLPVLRGSMPDGR